MKNSPKLELPRYSKAEMQRLYDDNNFDKLLSTCEEITCQDEELLPGISSTHPETIRIRVKKWRLNGVTIATIISYTRIDETTTHSIRMLRVGEMKYHAIQKFPF